MSHLTALEYPSEIGIDQGATRAGPRLGRTTTGQDKGMPARCRRSQGGRGVNGVSEGVRGDGVFGVGGEEYVAPLELSLF